MRAMVAHVASMVVASTVQSLVAVSTVMSLSAVNIPVGNLVAVSTVGNLRAVNVLAGSLAAARIVNAAAMESIATEREPPRCALANKLSGPPRRRDGQTAPGLQPTSSTR